MRAEALLALGAACAIGGCAPLDALSPSMPHPAATMCNPGGLKHIVGGTETWAFVGQKATAEAGAQMLAATGALTLRWVPPRTAVTMDFREERLTVSYDDAMVITSTACG